jgi:hypothetical protein
MIALNIRCSERTAPSRAEADVLKTSSREQYRAISSSDKPFIRIRFRR